MNQHSVYRFDLETVHTKGYRFIAEVQETAGPDHTDPPLVKPPKTARHRVLVAGAAMVLLVLLPAVDKALQGKYLTYQHGHG